MNITKVLIPLCIVMCGIWGTVGTNNCYAEDDVKKVATWQYAALKCKVQDKTTTIELCVDGNCTESDRWISFWLHTGESVSYSSQRKMKKPNPEDEKKDQSMVLDYLGSQGWELVSFSSRIVADYRGKTNGHLDQWYFKRAH